jgi:hypothetical protein
VLDLADKNIKFNLAFGIIQKDENGDVKQMDPTIG